ncbi:MAG: hypothetical protein ACI85K_000011 [Hyphomicrobiaceae bacterium]|jgi:hypothetical protein
MRLALALSFCRWTLLSLLASATLAQTPVVTAGGETMRLAASSVTSVTGGWRLTLTMSDDNGNTSLPNTWRRWWHCEVSNLVAGATLDFRIASPGYSDAILPVWSLSTDGVNFADYVRLPTSAVPITQSGQERFSVQVPAGVVAMRIAKYFPYTVTRKNQLLASLVGEPRVRSIVSLGNSQQGRPIEKIELTDSSVPDTNKERIWIHSGVHPAETTSYFVVEGLLDWLTSGDPFAEVLLDHALIEIVPMANPDGVVLGNYRTNANSVEIESQWSAPYTSPQPEVIALRTAIEGYMGTVANPASNPISILLNLHSTHNVSYPFHFQHVSNSNWTPGCISCGVLPIVNQVEGQWVSNFEMRSPLVALGSTALSSLGSRPFVESMCHDRWTSVNGWLNAPNFEKPVMAITFEGTYGRGPDGVTWNTEADYRQCGQDMGLALFDQLGLGLSASSLSYGSSCGTATLIGTLAPQPDGSHVANLAVIGGAPSGLAVLAVGSTQVLVPFPQPWANCTLLTAPDATAVLLLNTGGAAVLSLPVPAIAGLTAFLQAVSIDASLNLESSNGLMIENNY